METLLAASFCMFALHSGWSGHEPAAGGEGAAALLLGAAVGVLVDVGVLVGALVVGAKVGLCVGLRVRTQRRTSGSGLPVPVRIRGCSYP